MRVHACSSVCVMPREDARLPAQPLSIAIASMRLWSCLRFLAIAFSLAALWGSAWCEIACGQSSGQATFSEDEYTAWWHSLPRDQRGALLSPSGDRSARVAFEDLDAWNRVREDWVRAWRGRLGPMPAVGNAPDLEWIATDRPDRDDGVLRRALRIEVEPEVWVDAIVLTPDRESILDRSLPGCVALHPTTSMHIEELAGIHGKGPRAVGWHLAKRGFAVICPKCFLWQDADSFDSAVAKHRTRHPDALGMAKMLFDAQRAVDALLTLPEVDPNRLAAIGHSLGAKEVLYLMALDARIGVGVASEGGLAFDSTNWDAPWYLGQAIRDPSVPPFDHAQLLALIAPRPLLVMGGETGPGAADGTRSLSLRSAAAPIWSLYGEPLRLGMWNHGQGHVWDKPQWERAAAWLESGTKSQR